jgi:hypothetical protein
MDTLTRMRTSRLFPAYRCIDDAYRSVDALSSNASNAKVDNIGHSSRDDPNVQSQLASKELLDLHRFDTKQTQSPW